MDNSSYREGRKMIDYIKKLAWDAGEICLSQVDRITADDLDFKGKRDLVTSVDKKVENFIIERLSADYPGHDITGEESGKTDRGCEHRWIIDPIDGTTSYFHRQPYYAVSIAFQSGGITQAGVVFAPSLGQMFSAERGEGAYLNGSLKLSVSNTETLIESVLATGFACLRAGREPNNLHYLARILPEIRDFRRCGSAAIDLAYVAAGKVDGFWEMDLNIYDVAAGVLLVEEAGGFVCDMKGSDNYPEDGIVAGNQLLKRHMLEFFEE